VTIIFAQEGIVMPIIGIALAYLLIHVILEQLLLYPVLVGEAIGLTLVETIIVVLLGAVVAGVSGMILAVPAAALLKLLVPLFYETLNRRRLRKAARTPDNADPPGA
jgi:predicted PurR-regulated permease PerM